MPGTLGFRELGQMAYEPVWHAMQRFTNERGSDAADEIAVEAFLAEQFRGLRDDAGAVFGGSLFCDAHEAEFPDFGLTMMIPIIIKVVLQVAETRTCTLRRFHDDSPRPESIMAG